MARFLRDIFPGATEAQVEAIEAQARLYSRQWIEAVGGVLGVEQVGTEGGSITAAFTYSPGMNAEATAMVRVEETAVFAADGSVIDRPTPGAVAAYNRRKGRP